MAQISKITLPSGVTYDLKDAQARSDIEALQTSVTGGMHYIGVTTTALTDGATTSPIKVNNVNVTPKAGDIVMYGSLEFVWASSDGKWHEFGSTGSLKSLAFKDRASGSYTPEGSISPTFKGSSAGVNISVTNNTSGNYTPAGTITAPTFTGKSMTSTGSYTPAGTIDVNITHSASKTATVSAASSGTITYTPTGSIDPITFYGETTASSGTYTPAGTVRLSGSTDRTATVSAASSGTATYTPSGSIQVPIKVKTAGTTTKINNPSSKTVAYTVVAAAPGATAPSNNLTYYNVAGETLSLYQLGYTTGASVSTSQVTVKTGDAAYEADSPTFKGTGARLVTGGISVPTSATFEGTEATINVSGTPLGSVDTPAFKGTGVRLVTGGIAVPDTISAGFTGTAATLSVTGTTTGQVSAPTFNGTKVQISGTTTAAGTIENTEFVGTPKTVTVS